MENDSQFKDEINACFKSLEKLLDESFLKLESTPSEKEKIVKLWVTHVSKFVSYTYKASEKNNNKDIFKAITKALVFGK